MKIYFVVYTVFTLIAIAKGAWWLAAVQPVMLSFGAAFAALNLDLQPIIDVDWRKWNIFKQEKDEKQVEEVEQIKEVNEVKENKEDSN